MFRPLLRISRRTLLVTLNVVLVVAMLFAAAFGAFVWKLSKGPISLAWASNYVEEALSSREEQLSVRFDDIVFTWPELKGPFMLGLTNLKVSKGGRTADSLTIEQASVGLSRGALFFGRIRPVSVIVTGPALELVRTRDGRLNMFVKDKETQEAKPLPDVDESKTNPGETLAQLFKDMATHKRGSFISRLDQFIIRNASVAIRDHEYGLSWYLTDFDFGLAEHPQGIAASLDIALPGGRGREASFRLDMVYRKQSDDFRAAARVKDLNPYFISRFLPVPDDLAGQDLFLSGELDIAADTTLKPTYVGFKGAIPTGSIHIPSEYDAPVTLEDIAITAEYKAGVDMLNIRSLSGKIGGIAFEGEARGTFAEKSMGLPVRLYVKSAGLKQIPPLFPKSEHDGEAYHWLARDIESGKFSDVVLKMEVTGEKIRNETLDREEWSIDVPQMVLDFAFEDATVRYSPTLMPVTDGRGKGSLDLADEILTIKGEYGKIGDLEGRDIKVVVTDLMKAGAGYVAVDLNARGPVATALSYIAADPVNMGKEEIGIDAAKVKGLIDAKVHVGLPTIKDVPKEDVTVNVGGTMTELNIPDVVEGLTLSGGPLAIQTESGGFRIKGSAQLAGRAMTMEWHQYFESKGNPYSMQIAAGIGADKELRNHFGVALDDYISGTMPVDVVYTSRGDNTQSVEVKGDLNPVRIHIDPFKFEKPVGMPGTLTAKAALADNVIKELNDITITGRDFSVGKAAIKFAPRDGKSADLSSGTINGAKIGKTQMDATFEVDRNNVMNVTAKGPVFDLGPFLAETQGAEAGLPMPPAEKKQQQAMAISMKADTMPAANNQSIRAVKTYLEIDTDGDITRLEMDGGVGKAGNLFVRFRPDAAGKRTFRLESGDAGAVLYTFGLYENIHGGTLLIYGEPKSGELRGDLYGSMRMENFRVVKAPALASLLSLMSLTGVGDLLNNQGIVFSKLESDYEWRFRPEGNLLVIKDGKTSGSSVGLTFEGVVDRGKKTTDVSGTIIPMTEVNSLIAKIPLLGNLLGGETGLIAATYTMKGPSNNPAVMVNPLSVLAPGFLRNILFEGGYKSKIPEDLQGIAKPSAPSPGGGNGDKKIVPPATNASPKPSNTLKTKPAN